VQLDALQLRMRPRSAWEAADLGIRLAQDQWRSLYGCHAVVAVPLFALCIASFEVAGWLPLLLLFLCKPWLDRTSLFVLSRAAFGQPTRLSDLWRAQRQVLWRQLLQSWTWRRLSPCRSFTQPMYQLEGLRLRQIGGRRRQLRRNHRLQAVVMTGLFATAEMLLVIGLYSALVWFAPTERSSQEAWGLLQNFQQFAALKLPMLYALVVLLLEPLYVAAGFAMYLNRRAELEAWDLEQELRNVFAR